MKKRLLITSIVMMLVVAVALSTATYAWFTSNASVTASSMTIRAAVNTEDALGIGWTGSGANTSINTTLYNENLSPMAPKTLEVGTTTSEDLLFYTETTKQVGGVFKFNDTPATDVKPVVYNDGAQTPVKSFYVRNLSNANTISGVTVKPVFNNYMVEASGTYEPNVEYYTLSDETYTLLTGEAPSTDPEPVYTTDYRYGESITGTVYAYVPYVLTKDTTAVAGRKYYHVKQGGTNEYEVVTGVTAGTTDVSAYYEKATADDMIRVALFTKEYRLLESGTYESGTYYAYDPVDDVIKAASLTGGDSLAGYYSLSSAKHLLKCVLGKEDTAYVSVGSDAFDVNKVYFLRTGEENNYTYTQTAYTKSTYDSAIDGGAAIFTATSTAVYGTIAANGAVNALSYYNDVVNSYVIATNLKPGDQIDIVAYAWLDGTVLDDSRQGEVGTVSLSFSATNN